MEERAVVFIDGNNFYHGFINSKEGPGFPRIYHKDLDFMALARKLAMDRQVVETRYYIGQVRQEDDQLRYNRQRQFIHALERDGVICRMGRLEKRERQGQNTKPLEKWLASLPKREFDLEPDLRRELEILGQQTVSLRLGAWLNELSARRIRLHPRAYKELHQLRHTGSGTVWMEKAVDVMIATDMISMAHRDCYDAAYLLSADGDFTPTVDEVRQTGRKVFAASPLRGVALAARVNAFIPLKRDFFAGLWRDQANR